MPILAPPKMSDQAIVPMVTVLVVTPIVVFIAAAGTVRPTLAADPAAPAVPPGKIVTAAPATNSTAKPAPAMRTFQVSAFNA